MNKTLTTIAMTAMIVGATGCNSNDENIIERPEFHSADGIFSIDALEALGRVSNPQVSPDGSKVLFGISYESVEQNKSNNELYVVDIKGGEPQRLTRTAESENSAVWIDNGNKIAYLASDGTSTQLYVMSADGKGKTKISNIEGGIEGFLFSADEKKVVIIGRVKYNRTPADVYPDLTKANAYIVDDLMYKHWDEWVTEIPHPFVADFDGNKITNVTDIMQDEPFEAPMRPFGGAESFTWSPDGKQLIYVSRKKTGMEYSLSTNSDLYLYDLESKKTENITEGMMGYDTAPAYSPDGRYVAWLSMEHDGYESDKNRIFILDTTTGEKTDLTSDWDFTADLIAWAKDGKSIYFTAPYLGEEPIFNVNIATKEINPVMDNAGLFDYAALCPVNETTLVTMRHSMLQPNELCVVENGQVRQLTEVNKDIFGQLTMPTVEKVMVPTTDGKEMTTWVVYPQNFDPNKKYPAILYCQGGPQQAISQFWSYRWNLALMAANGYIVIAPNRRGLPGFGTEWNAQISKDYPGQNMKDYLSAVDFMKEKPYVDADHIGAVGASYGGFSVYWLAGNHDGRFACLIAHAGIFNMESQYLETEEMWFANWDMGGAFWDKDNAAAQRTFAASPHKFVDKWDTPILVTHGEYDFRILASQGMMAFNAARLRGIPAEMVVFPDENHWILKPQNAILWQRVFFRWLDKWLKGVDYTNPALLATSENQEDAAQTK
ncbi:MAG: S9 family peptidase [Muribaculaceae bacterium]|nr:S9 family peptidase [Muribaculaceae bacterium]